MCFDESCEYVLRNFLFQSRSLGSNQGVCIAKYKYQKENINTNIHYQKSTDNPRTRYHSLFFLAVSSYTSIIHQDIIQ